MGEKTETYDKVTLEQILEKFEVGVGKFSSKMQYWNIYF